MTKSRLSFAGLQTLLASENELLWKFHITIYIFIYNYKFSIKEILLRLLCFDMGCTLVDQIGKGLLTPTSSHVINPLIKHILISLTYFVPCKVVP